MTDWGLLKIEQCDDYRTINEAFTQRVEDIDLQRNPSEYRRLYVTYKDALRDAARSLAVKAGRRASDLDFDFSDDRHLDEFMIIIDNICSGRFKNSLAVWRSIIDDSDYRTLQRTDSFLRRFDDYMAGVKDLAPAVWKYLIEHFKVYGFAAQNKKMVADLQRYSGLEDDVFLKYSDAAAVKADERSAADRTVADVSGTDAGHTAVTIKPDVGSAADRKPAGSVAGTLLDKYMSMQDARITSEYSSDFFRYFERVYTHGITKNNLSAWRYFMQKEELARLLKQADFTAKLVNTMRNVEDLYPAVWDYIIDKTRVPSAHPMYEKTTGELIRLKKSNSYKGTAVPQGALGQEVLVAIIDNDDFVKGHDEYPNAASTRSTSSSSGGSERKSEGKAGTIIFIILFIYFLFRFIF